jgi:hypothetical protein
MICLVCGGKVIALIDGTHTSLPLAEKDLPLALAGSIPTEFGELMNLQTLHLAYNILTGMPPFAHFTLLAIESTIC